MVALMVKISPFALATGGRVIVFAFVPEPE